MFVATLPNERRAGLLFEDFPVNAHAALLEEIVALTRELEADVEGRVPVKSGDLLSHVRSFVDDSENKISGKVKISGGASGLFAKAGALEYGAHGRVAVKAHQRLISTVFGRAVAPTIAMVGAYARTANIADVHFMSGALDSLRGSIEARLLGAIERVEREASA